MGIIMSPLNLDEIFRSDRNKLIVNEYEPENKVKHIALLESLLLQEIESTLTFAPTCLCGAIRGGWKLGRVCSRCKTKVSRKNNSELDPYAWFKTKVTNVKFVSPGIYAFMNAKIIGSKKSSEVYGFADNKETPCDGKKFSVLKYLSSKSVRKNKEMSITDIKIIDFFEAKKGFERNFAYFSKNFLKICKIIAEIKGGNTGNDMRIFIEDLENSGDKWLFNHIPVINGRLVYKTSGGSGANKMTPTYNVVKTMLLGYIDKSRNDEEGLHAMALTNYKSACLYTTHVKELISSKAGIGRKHVMSTKLDFSARNVCIPTLSINNIKEVHLPYKTSIVLFRLHIANILLKRLSARETHAKIRKAKVRFDPEVYEILTDLIKDSKLTLENGKPYQGVIVGRNPGLLVGSILRLCLTHIKSDIDDDTMEVGTPLAKLPNWDYDGDLLYVTLPLSQYVYRLFEPLSPYSSVNSPKIPGRVYGKIGLGPIAPTNIANMINKERKKYGCKDGRQSK